MVNPTRTLSAGDAKALLKRTAIWFLPMAIALTTLTLIYVGADRQKNMLVHRNAERTVVQTGRLSLMHGIHHAVKNLLYIKREFDANLLCDKPGAYQVRGFQSAILNFYTIYPDDDQISWVDTDGRERMRLEANGGHPAFVATTALEDRKNQGSVSSTLALSPGQIYMSPLRLDIEHGHIERPYEPVMRFGTPVTDALGHTCGAIVFNYLGKGLFRAFEQNTAVPGKRVMLLNQDGYYLRSPRAKDAWGFMFGRKDLTLAHRSPIPWRQISRQDRGQFTDADGSLWTFETLDLGDAVRTAGVIAPRNQHMQWKIVTHLDDKQLISPYEANSEKTWVVATAMLALLLVLSLRLAQNSITRGKLEARLAAQAEEYEDLYNFAPCGYYSVDKDGLITRVNYTVLDWLGYTRDELVGQPSSLIYKDPQLTKTNEKISNLMNKGVVENMEFIARRKDGTSFPVALNATPIFDEKGEFLFSRSMLFDIEYQKRLENTLRMEARIDTLTGLHNRRSFRELAGRELSRCRRTGNPVSLMLFDLDFFKKINDTYGHEAGDMVLRFCSRLSAETIRNIDVLGRWGGEEFIVLLPDAGENQALQIAERLRQKVHASHVQAPDGRMMHYTISIGITDRRGDDDSLEEMFKRADKALYAAKHAGRNCVRRA